jgi:hypothetical protein
MMWSGRAVLIALCAGAFPEPGSSQSSLLTALETSAPAPITAPITPGLTRGLSVVWIDPTIDPHVTGAFFGVQHASYASVDVFHGALAFRLGPRWSIALGSAGLGSLFDSSLTSQDPSLSNLRAQATWGRLDATVAVRRLVANLGLSAINDDNVGVVQTSTLARANVRVLPFGSRRVTIGLEATRPIGGSVPTSGIGRQWIDVTFRHALAASSISLSAAGVRGALWRSSETTSGIGLAAQLDILSVLDVGVGLGRYRMAYGVSDAEWYRSVAAAIRIGGLRLGSRYTSTRIGLGSGFALSIGYESVRRDHLTKAASLSR